MSNNITNLDIDSLNEASSRLRALAHPVRITIINILEIKGEITVTEIYKELGMKQAAVSHHLNILKVNNVLDSRKDGREVYYKIKTNAVLEIIECVKRCNR